MTAFFVEDPGLLLACAVDEVPHIGRLAVGDEGPVGRHLNVVEEDVLLAEPPDAERSPICSQFPSITRLGKPMIRFPLLLMAKIASMVRTVPSLSSARLGVKFWIRVRRAQAAPFSAVP